MQIIPLFRVNDVSFNCIEQYNKNTQVWEETFLYRK